MNIAKLRVFRGLGSKVLKSASIKNRRAIRTPRVASPHLRDGVVYSGVSSTGVCSVEGVGFCSGCTGAISWVSGCVGSMFF